MFYGASSFTGDLGDWRPAKVQSLSIMFSDAVSFTSDLSAWNPALATDMHQMFDGIALSVDNYDSLLEGWAAQKCQFSMPGGNCPGLDRQCHQLRCHLFVRCYRVSRDGQHRGGKWIRLAVPILTVSGLQPGQSAAVFVTTTRNGYLPETAAVSGTALSDHAFAVTFRPFGDRVVAGRPTVITAAIGQLLIDQFTSNAVFNGTVVATTKQKDYVRLRLLVVAQSARPSSPRSARPGQRGVYRDQRAATNDRHKYRPGHRPKRVYHQSQFRERVLPCQVPNRRH